MIERNSAIQAVKHAWAKGLEPVQFLDEIPDEEFEYIGRFAKATSLDFQLHRNQLRSLWTAYCFHADLNADTLEYDVRLQELWDSIPAGSDLRSIDWRDFESFDDFMCAYLV